VEPDEHPTTVAPALREDDGLLGKRYQMTLASLGT
jgi:hypothetical protein